MALRVYWRRPRRFLRAEDPPVYPITAPAEPGTWAVHAHRIKGWGRKALSPPVNDRWLETPRAATYGSWQPPKQHTRKERRRHLRVPEHNIYPQTPSGVDYPLFSEPFRRKETRRILWLEEPPDVYPAAEVSVVDFPLTVDAIRRRDTRRKLRRIPEHNEHPLIANTFNFPLVAEALRRRETGRRPLRVTGVEEFPQKPTFDEVITAYTVDRVIRMGRNVRHLTEDPFGALHTGWEPEDPGPTWTDQGADTSVWTVQPPEED